MDQVIPETCWEQKEDDIKNFDIDIFAMGNDWEGKFDFLRDHCKVVYLPRTDRYISSTEIKKQMDAFLKEHSIEPLKHTPDLTGKKVWIAPHTPRSTMFAETFANTFTDAKILGFVDKVKTGEEIFKLEDVKSTPHDYMLILSANYFGSIYDDQRKVIPASKIIKVEITNNVYHFSS